MDHHRIGAVFFQGLKTGVHGSRACRAAGLGFNLTAILRGKCFKTLTILRADHGDHRADRRMTQEGIQRSRQYGAAADFAILLGNFPTRPGAAARSNNDGTDFHIQASSIAAAQQDR